MRGQHAVIVTNETVGPLYAARVEANLKALGKTVRVVTLPDGEAFKQWETLNLSSMRCFRPALTARPRWSRWAAASWAT